MDGLASPPVLYRIQAMANIQVVISQTLLSKTVLNVTNWQIGSVSDTSIQDLADSLRASYVAHVQPVLTDNWRFDRIEVREMDGGSPFTIVKEPTLGALIGGSTGDNLPTTVALLVSTSATAPKPNRGRVYFCGLSEISQTNSAWEPTTLNLFEDLVQEWADGLVVTGGNAFLRIARVDYGLNIFTANNPVEGVIAQVSPATIRNRRLG
jgi:hypothetical protein